MNKLHFFAVATAACSDNQKKKKRQKCIRH